MNINLNSEYIKNKEKNRKKMNYINAQKNQYKPPKSKTTCPTIYKYFRQHFNPRQLPRLLLHLLSNHYAQKINCTQSGDTKIISTIINIPSVSVMFSNMKLYDNQRIVKENRVIDAMLKIREKWSQMWDNRDNRDGNKGNQRQSNQRETACTFYRDRGESVYCRKSKKMELNLLQILELSYRSFDILDYRLKDLVSFLEVISHISTERQFVAMTQKQLNNTIYQLYNICDVMLSKIQRIKLYIQRCTGIFMQYGQKILVQGNKILLMVRNTEQSSKHQKNNLFLNRNHALYYKQKLKQINEKYTFISRQIFAKQAYERKKRKYRNKNKNKYRENNIHTQQPQYQCQNYQELESSQFFDGPNYRMGTFKGNFCSFGKNFNQQEFGKKKFGFKKEKRISIQVMASLLQQQFKSRRKIVNGVNSKFQQRPAISIGTKRNIQKKQIDPIKTNKQVKKQVKIDNLQLKKENKKQKKGVISKSNSPLASPKGKKQLKSTKKTKLQIFEQLCERADKENEENQKSLYSILGKKVHSWNQKNGSSYQSDSPIVSRSVISKCKTQMCPSLSRKAIFKTAKYLPRRSFLSCKQLKHYKESKKAKQKNQISESFQQLLSIALDKKGNKKKHLNMQRSGRIIPLDSQDYFQITQRFDISKKRNQQLKSKGNKERFKLGKSKYNQILEEGTNKENQQIFDQEGDKNILHAEPKVVRRVGITVSSDVQELKSAQSKQPQKLKQSIRRTFGSNCSRKQQAISNKRLHNEDTSTAPNKFYFRTKTQQPFSIPTQYKVKLQQKQNLSKRIVRMHTQIECSLYKITKQHEKLDLQQIEQQNNHRNKILELGKISDEEIKKLFKFKYKFNDGRNQMGMEDQSHMKRFNEENVQFGLSRVMLGEANRLHQKDMAWLGK